MGTTLISFVYDLSTRTVAPRASVVRVDGAKFMEARYSSRTRWPSEFGDRVDESGYVGDLDSAGDDGR